MMNNPCQATETVQADAGIIRDQFHWLEDVMALLAREEQSEARQLEVLERARCYFCRDLTAHMLEEEEVFFPAVALLPEGGAKVARLQEEHAQLHDRICEFRSGLVLAEHAGPEGRRGLLWRLIVDGRALLAALKRHAAYESELVRELNGVGGQPTEVTHVS